MHPWERQPGESQKAYNAFMCYRSLPVKAADPHEQRSCSTVSRKLGYKGIQQLTEWSARYKWVDRANAYTDRQNDLALQIREVGLVEYQQDVIAKLGENLRTYDTLVKTALQTLLEADVIDTRAIVRMGQALKIADDLARRNAGMPVTFRDQPADEIDYDKMDYTLGDVDG